MNRRLVRPNMNTISVGPPRAYPVELARYSASEWNVRTTYVTNTYHPHHSIPKVYTYMLLGVHGTLQGECEYTIYIYIYIPIYIKISCCYQNNSYYSLTIARPLVETFSILPILLLHACSKGEKETCLPLVVVGMY